MRERWRVGRLVPRRRRSMFLLLLGTMFVVSGASLAAFPDPDRLLAHVLPGWWIMVPYVTAGGVAVVTAFVHDTRERFGFMALFLMASIQACTSAISGVIYDSDRAFSRVAPWGLTLLIILLVSGWKEEDRDPDDDGGD